MPTTNPAEPQAVTPVETFFDLVYVFAISQLAEHLTHHLTWLGACQTLVLLVAVFTIWSFTTYESTMTLARTGGAQAVILGVMVLGLVMNSSITAAFGPDPWSFVIPMVAIQVGRSAATRLVDVLPVLRRHRIAMTVWAVFSAVPWFLGALTSRPGLRLAWWVLAVATDLVGAFARHPVPGLRREGLDEIPFDLGHQVERCRLFLIICLGEAIVRTGIGLAAAPQDLAHVAAAVASMVSLICVWLLFFGPGHERVDEWFGRRGERAAVRLARLATYGQEVLVVAFVAYAVGTEMSVAEPLKPLGASGTALLFGGMALCLAAHHGFLALLTHRRRWLSLMAGTAVVVVLAVVLLVVDVPALASIGLLAVVMAVVAWWHRREAPTVLATPEDGHPSVA